MKRVCKHDGCQKLTTENYCERHLFEAKSDDDKFAPLKLIALEPSAIPVTIICGCPGSGKNTYVDKNKNAGDIVIDLDVIRSDITGSDLYQSQESEFLLIESIRLRNDMLKTLSTERDKSAWFIICAPQMSVRRHWSRQLQAIKTVVLETPPEIAIERIRCDASRAGRQDVMATWVLNWWQKYSSDPFNDVIIRS